MLFPVVVHLSWTMNEDLSGRLFWNGLSRKMSTPSRTDSPDRWACTDIIVIAVGQYIVTIAIIICVCLSRIVVAPAMKDANVIDGTTVVIASSDLFEHGIGYSQLLIRIVSPASDSATGFPGTGMPHPDREFYKESACVQ